jgi:hypothetical protein
MDAEVASGLSERDEDIRFIMDKFEFLLRHFRRKTR